MSSQTKLSSTLPVPLLDPIMITLHEHDQKSNVKTLHSSYLFNRFIKSMVSLVEC